MPLALFALSSLAAPPDPDGESAAPRDTQAVGGSLAASGAIPVASADDRSRGTTHLWGQLQVWTTLWDQDVDAQADPATYGDPEADPGFVLQRGRIGMDGFVPMGDAAGRHQVDYALSVGIAAPFDVLEEAEQDVQLVDGFGRWALPSKVGVSSLGVGLQRIPFSHEALMSSAVLPFEEVAVGTNWLAPGRAVGAIGAQAITFSRAEDAPQVLLRVGAFDPTGDLFGRSGPALLASARVELIVGQTYRTFDREKRSALGVGVAALVDERPATSTTSFEADLLARYSLVTVMGEVVTSTISPTASDVVDPGIAEETGRLGWLGQLSVWIPIEGAAGVEIDGRYASFDDHTGLDSNGDVGLLHAGATVRNALPRTDLGFTFVHRLEGTTEVPNDTVRLVAQIRPEGRF
jgi:hypothetical protein